MKRLIMRLCALVTGVAALSSCLGDDDNDSTAYSDTAITQFTLGTLNRYTQTTSTSTGNDTIIKTSVTGSTYKMTIDHLQQRIYNTTLLPVGTDAEHVLCTITTKNNGVVAVKSITSDTLTWYSSTDSINLSVPRTFRVFATDGSGYRDYVVELGVSATTGISFEWQLKATNAALGAQVAGSRLVAQGDSVVLTPRDSIVGTSTAANYMLTPDGRLMSTADGGATWQEEPLDDSADLLPQAEGAICVSWHYTPADNTDCVLLVGLPRQSDVTTMRVWRKIAPHAGGGQWVYMPFDDANYYPLKRTERLSMVCYDGSVFAIGADMVLRQSRDQGITWRQSTDYALPDNLTGAAALMAADNEGRLWLLTDSGQLWQGVLR